MINENKFRKIKVISIRGLNARVRSIRFRFVDAVDVKQFSFGPGNFIMVGIPGYGESALAITTSPSELPEFEVSVQSKGNSTMALNRLQVGDIAYARGPLGKAIDFTPIYGRELVLIAGGMGLAPLRSIVHFVAENPQTTPKLALIYGAKTPVDLMYKDEFSKWEKHAEVHITVDKGDPEWDGNTGPVSKSLKLLKLAKNSQVILCGPPAMYADIIKQLLEAKVQKNSIHIMLERKMHCGIGKCQHCTCGDKYVCLDGPTFRYNDIEDNLEALS